MPWKCPVSTKLLFHSALATSGPRVHQHIIIMQVSLLGDRVHSILSLYKGKVDALVWLVHCVLHALSMTIYVSLKYDQVRHIKKASFNRAI